MARRNQRGFEDDEQWCGVLASVSERVREEGPPVCVCAGQLTGVNRFLRERGSGLVLGLVGLPTGLLFTSIFFFPDCFSFF